MPDQPREPRRLRRAPAPPPMPAYPPFPPPPERRAVPHPQWGTKNRHRLRTPWVPNGGVRGQ